MSVAIGFISKCCSRDGAGWPAALDRKTARVNLMQRVMRRILMSERKRLCLNMIVKNETPNLERCLSSVAPYIDCWVIGDTGSTDGTQDYIKAFFDARQLPGELHSFPFINFGQARNAALDYAYASTLTYDYLLFADADMELVVVDPDFRAELSAPSYALLQRAGISYWNTRLIRRDAGARYRGVTHEYVEVAGAERLAGVWYKDHASGYNRKDKFERDVKLLTEALQSDPENARYWFYLAQSYKDAGRTKDAIAAYAKRATMGGWDEEAWYARLQLARCLRQIGDESGFLRESLSAYNQRPQRAEPLYDLARFYREKGMNGASVLFCEHALGATPPQGDALFVEDYVYTTGLTEEFSITANYSHDPRRKERGFVACNWLALDRGVSSGPRNLARSNLYYYANPVEISLPSFTARQVSFSPPDGYRPSNPSITRWNDEIFMVQRLVNYTVTEDGRTYTTLTGSVIHTRNFLLRLNEEFEIQQSAEISPPADMPEPLFPAVSGFEDMRLFPWRDQLWVTANVREFNSAGYCEQFLARIERVCDRSALTDWRILRADGPRQHQKNWMPLVEGETLKFIYLCDPTRILNDKARTIAETQPAIAAEEFRGGSQLIAFFDGWLCLVHEVLVLNGARTYFHRFVWFDQSGLLKRVSRSFYFRKKGIEFAAGLAWHPDGKRLMISYGIGDAESWVATLDAGEALKILETPERFQSVVERADQRDWAVRRNEREHERSPRDRDNLIAEAGRFGHEVCPKKEGEFQNAERRNEGGVISRVLDDQERAIWVAAETNRALRSQAAVDDARRATLAAGLPLHPDPPKAWDNYLAIFHTLSTTPLDVPILDAGAGRESAYLPGLKKLGCIDLLGINLLEGGAETLEGIRYEFGDITSTNFARGYFGFVSCLSVIEHGVNWRRFLKEMSRILRPGGHLFVSMDYWHDPIDAGGRRWFGVPVKIFEEGEVREMIGYANPSGLRIVGDVDLSCEERVISCDGLYYTFFNLLFRKDL